MDTFSKTILRHEMDDNRDPRLVGRDLIYSSVRLGHCEMATRCPRLRLTVTPGYESINMPTYEGKTLILAEIVNYGDRSTTLTHLCFFHYTNLWQRLCNMPKQKQLVPLPNTTPLLPHELKPGTRWQGIVIQTKELEEKARNGFLLCAIFHTYRRYPKTRRVVIK